MIEHRTLLGREDSETALTRDLLVMLSKDKTSSISVRYPPGLESSHGADLEIWLRIGPLRIGFRLQAKILKPLKRSAGKYEELDHVVGTGSAPRRKQIDILISATKPPLNPGYLFYNGLENPPGCDSACCLDTEWEKRNGRLGITVASAHQIKDLLSTAPRAKRLETVLPRSVPFPCLATCLLPTTQRLPSIQWLVREGVVVSDHFDRLPGWILTSMQGDAPLWVSTPIPQGSVDDLSEQLELIGIPLRMSEAASPPYIERLRDPDWSPSDQDGLPNWPVVVIDLDSLEEPS